MNLYMVNNNTFYLPLDKKIIKTNKDYISSEDFYVNNKWINSIGKEIHKNANEKFIQFEKSFPSSGGLLLTNKCPMKCVYCYYESGKNDNTTISKEKVYTYVKYLVKNAVMTRKISGAKNIKSSLTLTGGGEPTSDFNIFKYAIELYKEMCANYGIKSLVHLVTNGVLTKEKVDYIVENVDAVNISFDGLPDIQNNNRPLCNGNDSFDIVDKAMKMFDMHDYKYVVRTTVSEENFGKMQEMADFLFSNYTGLEVWHVEPVFKVGRAENMCFTHTPSFYKYYLKLMDYKNEKHPNKSIFNSSFSYRLTSSFCKTVNGTGIWLDAKGDLVNCTERISNDNPRLGYIENDTVVNEENHSALLSNYLDAKENNCQKCIAFYHCAGGCPMRMKRDHEGKFIDDSSELICASTKQYWKDVIFNLIDNGGFMDMSALVANVREDCTIYDIIQHENNIINNEKKEAQAV